MKSGQDELPDREQRKQKDSGCKGKKSKPAFESQAWDWPTAGICTEANDENKVGEGK